MRSKRPGITRRKSHQRMDSVRAVGACGDIPMRNPAALGPAGVGASGGSSAAEKGRIQRCGMRLARV